MAAVTAVLSSDFVVAEQLGRSSHALHVFDSYEQFKRWRKDNPTPVIVSRRNARGRPATGVDHRNEFEYL